MNINITILGQAISFVIFVLFCMKYVWEPIITVIEKRQKMLADIFANAEQSKKNSEVLRIEANNCLQQARCEAELIIKRANEYSLQLINQAKFDAESEKNNILFQSRQILSIEKKRVIEELQKEMGLMLISALEKVMVCSINKNIDYNITNIMLNDLELNINNKINKNI
ncbi:F0F1 ATP synthase subunit B [Blochmannia endosymbiont of Polyrhachis (Hedomyrma) turneri]|uniref:F0F1 ATP synthase subunit B n=1 Tax=Blochmannia endosymbiont of Polyrhachis (Hedomyrma) turneri TaxID=1505596 RepID=UPI00061A5BD5|nr:F0F1 ATP synthase subunit B [Blochmannia endosymbiont of Polyrhachis (Hedomyrma) turneri]AKC59600.1 ATP synthase subunit b [Blochmannia endosymbiont of Polyrhachis (Hedomyrma) turneri]